MEDLHSLVSRKSWHEPCSCWLETYQRVRIGKQTIPAHLTACDHKTVFDEKKTVVELSAWLDRDGLHDKTVRALHLVSE